MKSFRRHDIKVNGNYAMDSYIVVGILDTQPCKININLLSKDYLLCPYGKRGVASAALVGH